MNRPESKPEAATNLVQPEIMPDPICLQYFQALLADGLRLMKMWYPSSQLPLYYSQLTEAVRKSMEVEAWPFFQEIYGKYAKLPERKVPFIEYFYQFSSQSAHFLDALYHGLVQPR
jgi:hypothetical protein